jgi:hypothetical protein
MDWLRAIDVSIIVFLQEFVNYQLHQSVLGSHFLSAMSCFLLNLLFEWTVSLFVQRSK